VKHEMVYVSFMERYPRYPAGGFVHGVEIIALGVALFMLLELEKLALSKSRNKHDGNHGSQGRSEAKS